ncbi:MAG: hypothetical protein K2U26_02905 [Cyclobacteriaceae bacterium]|nr:hypothetical protein [Cyclobacteriaceae bacterium]
MSVRTSILILLAISLMATLYHISILVGIMPYEAAWGGRLKSREEMIVFEGISLVVQLILILVLLAKGQYIQLPLPGKWINIILRIFMIVFILNTVGNIFAINLWERFIATPLTLISAILLWNVVRARKA